MKLFREWESDCVQIHVGMEPVDWSVTAGGAGGISVSALAGAIQAKIEVKPIPVRHATQYA